MSKESIQKEIDCLRDVKNHLWNATIVSVGGSLTLMFNVDNLLRFNLFDMLKLFFCLTGF